MFNEDWDDLDGVCALMLEAVDRIAALEAALEPFAYARNHSGSEIAVADFDRARSALVKIEEKSE